MAEQKRTDGSLALNASPRIITIPAAEAPDARRLRVAAYCRVSSDSEDQLNSFAAQNAYYTALITGNSDWDLVDIYADKGITGTSADKREDFQRLIADCKRSRIDKVLVKSVSRFARNTKDCLEVTRDLKSIGVSVCFEEQNIDTAMVSGEMMTAIFASLAQKESESISQNMRMGIRRRMEQGTFFPSAIPYGYTADHHRLVVNEDQAKIIRRIFQEYLSGRSMDDIAKSLNEDGVPVRIGHDRIWRNSAITYILSNERYIGDSLWQKTYATDTLPMVQVKNHGERQQYYASGTHPAIISKEIFEAAKQLKSKRGSGRNPMKRHIPYPLRRKIHCGQCGTLFRRKVGGETVYWTCRQHDQSMEKCGASPVQEETIYDKSNKPAKSVSEYPVSQHITASTSDFVRPFFSTLLSNKL